MQHIKSLLLGIFIVIVTIGSFLYVRKNSSQTDRNKSDSAQMLVGFNAEYPPFAFMQDGEIVGYDVDILEHVAQKLGKKLVKEHMPFDALIPQIQLGRLQVAASGMSPSPEREKAVLFTALYHTGDPLIIVTKKNNPINTVDALRGKKVVVNQGFIADTYVSKTEGITDIMRLGTVSEAILALTSGRVDAFVTARDPLNQFFAQHDKNDFNVAIIPDAHDQYAFVVSKYHPEYQALINNVLEQMKQDGTLDTLKKKWGLA